jgi:Spy/CpxP family protein refolding chaperone
MRQPALLFCLLIAAVVSAFAQTGTPPTTTPPAYSGQEKRETKALSAEEEASLLNGEGMGMAKAAELNHYPGPRHVLELSRQLRLTPEQTTRARAVFERMRAEAVRLGALVVAGERELDRLFARGEITPEKLREMSREIAAHRGDLRAAHLHAHLETRALLTPEQVKRYDELRGYGPQKSGADKPAAHGKH